MIIQLSSCESCHVEWDVQHRPELCPPVGSGARSFARKLCHDSMCVLVSDDIVSFHNTI